MHLKKNDIVGHKLVRICQTYELLDTWIHFAQNYFVLDSGVAFTFPLGPDIPFTSVEVPSEAEEIVHPAVNSALGSRIAGLYRPRQGEYFEPDQVAFQLDSGLWVTQLSSAPEGVQGSVGVYIGRDAPDDISEMVGFWL